jgi:hypothetical protein
VVWIYNLTHLDYGGHSEISIISWDDPKNLTKEFRLPSVMGGAVPFVYKSEIYLFQSFIPDENTKDTEGLKEPAGLIKWNPKTRKYSAVPSTGNAPCIAMDPVICLHKDTLYYMSFMNHELFKLNLKTLHWTFIDYDVKKRPFPYPKSLSFLKDELIIIGKNMYENLEGYGPVTLKQEYLEDSILREPNDEEPVMDIKTFQHFLRRRFGDDEDAIKEFLQNEKEQTLIVKISQ